AGLVEEVRAELAEAESDAGDPTLEVAQLERAALDAAERARTAAVEREARAERARQALAHLLGAELASRDAVQLRLDEVLERRAAIERELTGAAERREAALSVSYELRSGAVTAAVQREAAHRPVTNLRADL